MNIDRIFENANKNGTELTGYVLISKESMLPKYALRVYRTYLFSSGEKRWKANMCSSSIWADCLDGEVGVKLSEYINGKVPDWKVEESGIVSFLLTTIFERDVYTDVYPTLKAAQAAMKSSFELAVGSSIENYREVSSDEGALEDLSAWANDAGPNDGNCDWKITRLYTNPETGITLTEEQFLNRE